MKLNRMFVIALTMLALTAGPVLAGGSFTRMGQTETLPLSITDDGQTAAGPPGQAIEPR